MLTSNTRPIFASYISGESERLISVVNTHSKSYPFYCSTGVNSQYKNTWLPMRGISLREHTLGWIEKPRSLSKEDITFNVIAKLKLSPATNAEKKAVVMGEEVLVFRHDEGTYSLGFNNANGVYEEQPVNDEEFSSWMQSINTEKNIEGIGFVKKINSFIMKFSGQIVQVPPYSLNNLCTYYKERYSRDFIEFLYSNNFCFKIKSGSFKNSINEFLGRFGNMECLCISYLIGGGFWETPESKIIKEYIRKVYAVQLIQLHEELNHTEDFRQPTVTHVFEVNTEDYNRLAKAMNTFDEINQFIDSLKNNRFAASYHLDFNLIYKKQIDNCLSELEEQLQQYGLSNFFYDQLNDFIVCIRRKQSNFSEIETQYFINQCKAFLNQSDTEKRMPIWLEERIKSLQNSFQSSLVQNKLRHVEANIGRSNLVLNFNFVNIGNTREMLSNLKDSIHFLFKHEDQLFSWHLELTDSPIGLHCQCQPVVRKNNLIATYAFINTLAKAGFLDNEAVKDIKQIYIQTIGHDELVDSSRLLFHLQNIYNDINVKTRKLDDEVHSDFYFFSSTRENKSKKLELLKTLELYLAGILNHSYTKISEFNEKLSALKELIVSIKSNYNNEILESKTLRLVDEVEAVLSSSSKSGTKHSPSSF